MSDDQNYTQVAHWHAANRLREDLIESGARDGDKIDREDVLADRYGVARNTMRRAIAQLRNEGIVASVHGRGTYAAAVPRRAVVTLFPGDFARSWLPDDAECAALRLSPGVPVMRVTRAGGSVEHYDASRIDVTGPMPVAGP